MNDVQYTYGSITANNGTRFRARRSDDGKVEFMSHQGAKNASSKVGKTFVENGEAGVSPSNRYLFPDEYENASQSSATSRQARWVQH